MIAPAVIFKGKELQEQWFDNECRKIAGDWYFHTSEKGWTDDSLAVEWLVEVFLPGVNLKRKDDSDAVLLIMDGHGSHRTVSVTSFLSESQSDARVARVHVDR